MGNMSVDYQMKIGNQMARSNGSLLWQNGQKLEMDASYSYQFNDNRTYLLFITLVNSTISTVPSLKAILKYEQIPLEFDSELTVQTSPKGLLSAISSGKIIYGENFTKYFATLSFETPFLTLKKFGLSGDFSMDVDNNINGIIHLIGNGKKYITTLEAKLKYWRESRIVFHISTPFEKYKVLSGKFTLSQSRKHLLIDLRSSTSVLVAAEILYIYNNITNFDMKLRGQTSFTFINTVLIVGKIQSHNIDVRVGWNRVMVGLIGSSRYTSYRDIDYGLQIFTPIEGYSKGSAIARFFYSDRFDLEAAVSLAEKKVGLKIQAMLRPDEDFAIPYTPEPAKLSNDTANETVNSTLANNTTFINFIQNTSEPVEPIKPDLSSALFTLNEAPPGTVYWRSMFQLNTPLYPTVHGVAQINEDGYDYNFLMYLSFPFGQLKMTNDLTYKDIFNIENDMKVITTCKCLEELQTNFYIKGTSAIHLSSELNMIAQVFNKSYQGNSEFVYDYYSFNEENTDGVYNVTALLKSPFQIVRHSLFNAYLKADNPIYIGNITVELNNNSVSLDGLIEVDEKYFVANVGAKINSSFLPIPMCRLIFHKDFTDVEKKLDIGVGLPNERGDSLVHYGIGGMWQYEDSNFMKYAVEIRTPYRSVGKIKCSIQYEHDQHKDISYLEAYLQYSNSTVLTATSELDGKSIKFNIDSTYETNKKIIIKGSFTNRGDRRNFDAVLSSDKEYKLVGWATVLPEHPIMLEVKLYKTKDDTKELLGGVINIVKVPGGYEMKTLIRKSGHHINVECEFMQLGDQGKQFHIMVATNYPGYESLIFDTILLNSNFELMMAKINASIKSKFLTTDLKLNANISLKNDAGLFNLLLTTPKISTDAKITWVFNWLEYLLLNFNGKLDYDNMTKELMSKFHFWNLNSKYDKISFGANINYNRKFWWLCTNGTLLWPNWKDLQLAVFIIVPDSGQLPAHRVLAKFKYLNDFSYFTHLIDYISHSTKFDFRTLSKVISSSPYIKGAFLVKTGRHRIFDNFSIKNSDEIYNIWNLLQSTNMKHDLLLEIQYKNFKPTQFVNLVLYYPKPTDLVTADLEFTSIKNLYARMNCSTPFKAFPEIKSYLNIVTNKTFYQRLAEIKWLKNNAIFNFTQLVTWMKKNQLTDGKILLDFPLTSRHIGLLAYKYESSDMKADGQSSLLYNGDTIMSGNYTRDSEFTAKRNKDKIIINVNNSFMPAGIIYNHKLFFLDPGSKWNSQDIKRIELFRLNDRSNFSIVGEIQFQENKDDKLTTFKAFHSRRKFIFEKLSEGKSKSITTANFTLKPNVWCATGFKLIDKDSVNGQEIQFNISYPRRLFTLNIDYVIDIDDLILEMTANPNLYSQAKHLTAIVRFNRKPIDNYHLMSIEIAHPYLVQNISAILSYLKNENVLANLNLSLEYANDINRKVILNMKSEKVVGNATKFYIFNVYAIHPASRLKITGYGNLRMGSKLLVFNKNITYSRSYMPLQFWITNAELNILKKLILIERKSLRDSSYLKAMFGKTGSSRYWANATLLKDKNFTVGSDFYIDIDGYKTELNMNFTPDASNRLRMLGAYNDHRDLKLIIWRTIYTFDVYDFKILARLNNSRMLTSSIKWRPEIYSEIMDLMQSSTNYIWNYAIETANFWTQYIRMESMDTLTDIWYDARPVLQDFLIDIRDLKHLQQDLKYFEKLFNDSYDANEFFMQDIYSMYQALTEEISFRDKMSHVPKIVNELWEVMGETSETIRQSVLWAVQSLKSIYEKIVEFLNGLATGETMDMISQYLQKIAAKYDKIIKDMHIKFLNYMEELWNETGNVIAQYWMKTLRTIEPAFIQLAHHIEAFFWQGSKRVIEFLYEKQSELMKSAVFRSNSNFTKDLEKFYDDITKNDFWTNMRKYSKMLYDIVTEKYFASVPFGYELNEIGTEIVGEIKELYNLPFIKFTVQIGVDVYDQVIWLYKYLNVEEKVQVVIPVIYNVIKNYSHTALDNEMINHPSSTKFIFKPESGEIYLEQKLPIPWHAFNLTPNFAEIPEYKRLVTLHSYIAPTNRTFWTYYYYFAPLLDPSNWLPPFSAQAMIIGGKHIVTFDGISYELEDCNCSYLLAKEFVFGTFSLALIDNNSDQPDIALIAYDKTLYFDFLNDVISLDNNQVPSLPLLINDIHIYAQEGLITVRSSKGFFLRCNFKFNVCTLRLSGWYFGKVAGLLGTMDNEPTTDFTTSNNNIVKNVDLFTKSWALESCTKSKNHQKYNKIDNKKDEECKKLFSSKNSSFVQCFTFVDPQPYYSMCLTSAESSYGDFICTAAYAYIQACGYNYIPIKIPTYCVQCPINEGFLEEGDFVILNGESVTQSTDVVFIVEAKSCNEYMRERRIVSTFSSILTKEFDTIGLHDNRYAVIAYGGTGIFDHPRSILVNNQIFTHAKDLSKYFEKIISGNGNTDIFGALRFATKLQFRPTVSKTFILMPCSDCDLTNMTVEYNVLNQEFIEKNITLHILMNADFDLEKLRVNKMFYGLDSERAYTKNDFKILKGDIELRRQIKLTKSMMGYCTTLALETNGTIFTGKKMGSENMALVKKFSSVFARRISATAQPDSCQTCECSSDDDGIEYIDCLPCTIPIPAYTDIDFRDNGTLSLLQAFEHASDII